MQHDERLERELEGSENYVGAAAIALFLIMVIGNLCACTNVEWSLKQLTREQLLARYSARGVAEALIIKACLLNQEVAPRPRPSLTAAQIRRSVQVRNLALAIAQSRRA